MKRHNIFFFTLLSLVLVFPALSFSLDLWDDFAGILIDPGLWRQGEYVREIKEIDGGNNGLVLKLANTNPVLITSYANSNNNNLNFSDPDSVNSIQADVAIFLNINTNTAYTRARLVGRWYNDGSGTPGSDMTGDIQAEISLRGSPSGLLARWEVIRFTNAGGSTSTTLGAGDFTTPITLDSTYTLFISYDSAQNKFTFRIGIEEIPFGPLGLPAWVRNPNSPWKALNARAQINNSASSCFIAAAFDNVYKNGALYDDFSSSVIDQTKWTTYELVNEISSAKLRSKVRSSSASSSPSILSRPGFIAPNSINMIQAKITPTIYQNGQGAEMAASLGGYFYNDGTLGGGYIGEVVANVTIGGTGVNPVAGWVVFKFSDYDGNNVEILDSGTFTTPITLGNTYTMFIGWNGSDFTFKFEGETAYYTPTTSINSSNKPGKGIGTRISNPQGKEATIEALFDDVMVGPTGYNDDFSGAYIDTNKWKYGELVREIDTGSQRLLSKTASPNPLVATSFPYTTQNDLGFLDPNSINSIQADVAILENIITNTAYTRARLYGVWYNDGSGTPGSDRTGDIQAEISLRGNPSGLIARWEVIRLTNATGGTATTLGSGDFTTPITLGSTYTLFINYDSVQNKFTFRLGIEEIPFGPSGLPAWVRDPNVPWKNLNTRSQINNDISSAYISAAFDNVYKNGVLYDDFSSSVIDQTKWTVYEFVREIASSKFRSKVRSSSASTSNITSALEFLFPSSVNVIQTEVTPLIFNNAQGASLRARIAGYYYNDGTSGGGYIGDVFAQVRIGGSATNPKAEWSVSKCTDLACNSSVGLAGGTFTTTITLGETYTLFLGWNGSQLTFRIDNEVAFYTPSLPINPPNNPYKIIGTQIYNPSGKEATIEALFDNVIVNNATRAEIIGTWGSGIWYYNVSNSTWTTMYPSTPSGPIAAGDVTGDGKADVISCWPSGLWYQNGATLGWTKVYSVAPSKVAAGDITGDGRAEIVGTWGTGIWYYNLANSTWTKMYPSAPIGPIAAGDVTGDGKADVISCWASGLWYQNGATLGWTKVYGTAPSKVAAGDITGDGRAEIVGTWGSGIWYYNLANSTWTKMYPSAPIGPIAVGDVTGDGKADVISCWSSGLWYQNGATLGWTKVYGGTNPSHLAVGDITGN